jgi:hypothetical protein
VTEQDWYGVRTLYIHKDLQRGQDHLYEERIVLVRASSSEEALARAEAEAQAYAVDEVEYLGFAMAFHMFQPPSELVEVYSLMRESRMQPEAYVKRFFDTGRERSQ